MADEECFPRGKPPKVESSFSVIKKPKLKVDQPSNLFRENPMIVKEKPEKTRDRKRKNELEGWPKSEQENLDLSDNRLKSVDYLTFTKMHEGMLLLGCVKEIYELEMLISLPNCNTGYVKANRISEFYTAKLQKQLQSIGTDTEAIASLSDLFQIGQSVICCICGLNPITKNIQLSLDPQFVNEGVIVSNIKNGQHLSCVIKSIEDHGYIVDIGKKNVNAFIPFKQADSNTTLVEGNVVRCNVTSVKGDGKILTLSNDQKKLKKTLTKSDHGITLDSLLPGTLVKFTVTKDMQRGQIGGFLGFEGSVAYIHSLSSHLNKSTVDSVKTETEVENSEEVEKKEPTKKRRKKNGKKQAKDDDFQEADQNLAQNKDIHDNSDTLVACILYITAWKHVALATNPKMWKEADRIEMIDSIQEKYVIGQKCKFFAKQKLKGIGLIGQLDKNGPTGIVLIKNLSDNRIDITMSDLPEKKSYKAKVINNCNVEGIVELTLKRSMLEAAFLRFEDVQIGGIVQAKVLSLNERGYLVMIGSGKEEEFRGCGNLKGFISFMHISDIVLQHPEKKYAVSDVITCRVTSLDEKRRFIHLTCKATLVNSKLPTVTSYSQVEVGQIVHGYISVIKDFGCIMKLYNDIKGLVPKSQLSADVVENPRKTFFVGQVMRARVLTCDPEKNSLKLSFCLISKKTNTNREKAGQFATSKIVSVEVTSKEQNGFKVVIINKETGQDNWIAAKLYKEHLSDFLTISQDLFSSISVGMVLENCVAYSRRTAVNVSMKKSIYEFASSHIDVPLTFADLQEEQMLPGFIQQITSFGVFVNVTNGLVGLCPKSMMTDYYLESTSGHFYEGQSVVAKVAEVNPEKKRFLLSLRPSECNETEKRIMEYNSQRNKLVEMQSKVFEDLSMGSVVDITCHKESETQVVTINGIDNDYSCQLLEETENNSQKAVVVYVDIDERKVYLTALEPVINYHERSSNKLPSNDVVFVNIIFMNNDISIGYVSKESKSAGGLVVVSTNLHCNDYNQIDKRVFKVGQTIKSEIIESMANGVLLGKLQLKPGVGKRIRKDSEMSDSAVIENEFKNIKIGQQVVGLVKSIKATYALVHFDELPGTNKQVTGRLHVSEIFKDVKDITKPLKDLKVGQSISCYVIGCRDVITHHFLDITNTKRATRGVLELSLFRKRPEFVVSETQTIADLFSIGSYVTAYVKSYDKKHKCFQTEIIPGVKSLLPRLFASEDPDKVEKSKTQFKPGMGLKCHVIKNDGETLHIAKTDSFVSSKTGNDVTELESGCSVNVEIRKIVRDGLLVHGEFDLQGKVFLTDFFDEFVDNPFQFFHQGQIVRCCVVDNTDPSNIHLSLRKSVMRGGDAIKPVDRVISLKSLKKKQILRGYIKSCSSSGVFVSLSRGVHGRVTYSKATQYYVADQKEAEKIFFPGKVVKCCVLRIMPQDDRVELSMLSRDTKTDDVIPSSTDLPLRTCKRKGEEVEDMKQPKKAKFESKALVERLIKETKIKSDEYEVETGSVSKIDDVDEHDVVMEEPGFVWDENEEDFERSSEEEDSGIEDHVSMKKKSKSSEGKNEEREIMEREKELMDGERAPQSAVEWERMMVSNPQSSMLWVRYMAFHLHLTETDKARAVAEKALTTIGFREEQEKLNVWVALLNLENLYGTDVTLEKTLERAMQQNDQLKVLTHLVKIFTESGKLTEADETYQKLLKKFRKDKDVWIAYIKHLMMNQKSDQANSILKRSTEALDKKQHLEIISKFAQFEFSFGEPENGKAMFENALMTYPKRTDIWSIYIDTLIKAKRVEEARNVLERVTTISISSKKMKSFFKRFVEFEKKYGDEGSVNKVKQKAIDYMEAQINKGMDD